MAGGCPPASQRRRARRGRLHLANNRSSGAVCGVCGGLRLRHRGDPGALPRGPSGSSARRFPASCASPAPGPPAAALGPALPAAPAPPGQRRPRLAALGRWSSAIRPSAARVFLPHSSGAARRPRRSPGWPRVLRRGTGDPHPNTLPVTPNLGSEFRGHGRQGAARRASVT
jgi:hypothetical protein